MTKYLVVVESPNKTKKIESILGSDYKVVASFGHIMDLDPKSLSIDVANNFKPNYIVTPDKKKVVSNLQYNMKECDEVIIASDLDREGEAIGYNVATTLGVKNPKRIVFNSITKKAIMDAVSNPSTINMDMVYSQQARRLLDRLMGYLISPVLQKHLQGKLSAGRVQSVVVRIIVDMENNINTAIQELIDKPFFKSVSTFNHNNTKINATLTLNNEIYHVKDKETAVKILQSINSNTQSIVSNVNVKETKKNPPPPHITSTLMQEASTMYGMNSKRTMEVAQKLYEGGYITYMRTDSTALSQEAVNGIEKYVIQNYGKEYYTFRSGNKKAKDSKDHAQEAHEAIRPTNIDTSNLDGKDKVSEDMKKLYSIIWKRAVASLMSSAIIDVQTVDIDLCEASKPSKKNTLSKSILPDGALYRATFEEIKFDGYLALYNDHESENKKGMIDIKINTIIEHIETEMNETHKTPPLHYNEAGLIKYLKKEGIGRPSTYASIISKVIEREYVEIKNIEGIAKDVDNLSISNNKYGVIKEKRKTVKVGAEKQKLVPTELGITVNNFMMTHFEPVMGIEFTANMENMLDMIAEGKAKWYNILKQYYDIFNPIVERLNKEAPPKEMMKNDDKYLGDHDGCKVYLSKNKYGWCVKMLICEDGSSGEESEDDEKEVEQKVSKSKWKYGSIGDIKPDEVDIDIAIEALQYPKYLGKIGAMHTNLCKGKFGFYFKVGSKIVGIKDIDDVEEMTLELAKSLYTKSEEKDQNTFLIGKSKVYVKTGPHGPYIMIPKGTGKPTFISIPKNMDHTKMTAMKIKELIDKYKEYKKKN